MYSEIQKNSSIFSNLTETMQIIDKRKKQVLAMAYPVQNVSVVDKLAEKDRKRIFEKMNFSSNAELISYAIKNRLI